jgi:hypothetical protein
MRIMKASLTLLFLFIPLCCAPADCASNECDKDASGKWIIQKIGNCPGDKPCTRRKDPDGGNHRFDPELDKRKNIWADDPQEKPVLQTIEWMKHDLERHPVSCEDRCPSRKRLKESGEGKKITVVAWALTARRGGVETANCDIPYVRKEGDVNTDNHIVLLDPKVTNPTLDQKTEWGLGDGRIYSACSA